MFVSRFDDAAPHVVLNDLDSLAIEESKNGHLCILRFLAAGIDNSQSTRYGRCESLAVLSVVGRVELRREASKLLKWFRIAFFARSRFFVCMYTVVMGY